jgi:SPP1 family predicted phage head-tail adaptor
MNAGDLRHRITLQKQRTGQDNYGQPLENEYDDFTTVWAAVNPILGKEYFAAETIQSDVTHRIRLRYCKGITPDMRVKFGDRYFTIISLIIFLDPILLPFLHYF